MFAVEVSKNQIFPGEACPQTPLATAQRTLRTLFWVHLLKEPPTPGSGYGLDAKREYVDKQYRYSLIVRVMSCVV